MYQHRPKVVRGDGLPFVVRVLIIRGGYDLEVVSEVGEESMLVEEVGPGGLALLYLTDDVKP